MDNTDYATIRRTAWKVDVLNRLDQVVEDIKRAIAAAGWTLSEDGDIPRVCVPAQATAPGQGTPGVTTQDDASIRLLGQAQAVVETTDTYIRKTTETLNQLKKRRQRFWDLLTGDLLMSAYINLHAAESTRVLLFSSDQLAAFLPSIRQRAAAFLPAGDPNADALKTLPDPTQPAHQIVAARVQAQAAPQAAPTVPQAVPAVPQAVPAAPQAVPAAAQRPTPPQDNGPAPGAGQDAPDDDAPAPNGQDRPVAPVAPSVADAGNGQNPPGNQSAGQPQPPSPDGTATGPTAPPGGIVLTGMLGPDQQVAAQVLNAACRAEDAQQLEVRHFRGVLYGASAVLLAVVAVIWIAGAIHPAYFPLCWPVSGAHPAMICPTNGTAPSGGDVPLVIGMGALGATLSVALNLAGLKPAGVHFSLTVAQGLNKIVLGAITAVLGIIILRTVTNAPGFLGTQPGLLTTAVVFGYSQQVFTRLIDRQASQLMSAASPATSATGLPKAAGGAPRGRASQQ